VLLCMTLAGPLVGATRHTPAGRAVPSTAVQPTLSPSYQAVRAAMPCPCRVVFRRHDSRTASPRQSCSYKTRAPSPSCVDATGHKSRCPCHWRSRSELLFTASTPTPRVHRTLPPTPPELLKPPVAQAEPPVRRNQSSSGARRPAPPVVPVGRLSTASKHLN
jgi:hypothetical protein